MGLRRYVTRMPRYLMNRRILFALGAIFAIILWLSFMWIHTHNQNTEPGNEETVFNLKSMQRDNIDGVIWQLPDGKDEADVLPSRHDMLKMTHEQLANLYHSYIVKQQVMCEDLVRVGSLGDGGRYICNDQKYRPKQHCLVYSFGIGYDFSFDDGMVQKYQCEVHSFDPSMNMSDTKHGKIWFHRFGLADFDNVFSNGWEMRTLSTIKSQLGHSDTKLDVLKVDIEEWEWLVLPNIISSGVYKSIRQLAIEIHITIGPEPLRKKYLKSLLTLKNLYNAGFRILLSVDNHWCDFTSRFDDSKRTGCHDILFVRGS